MKVDGDSRLLHNIGSKVQRVSLSAFLKLHFATCNPDIIKMKILDKLNAKIKEDKCHWSFEYFPPKTEQGVLNLYNRLEVSNFLGHESLMYSTSTD